MLGLVYFHAIADAESVLALLKAVVAAYQSADGTPAAQPMERYLPLRWRLVRHHPGVVARRIVSLPYLLQGMRRSCRLRQQDTNDFTNKFVWFVIPPGTLKSMSQSAKTWGVTLNDLFLAIFLKAVSPWAPDRLRARRRRAISLGCIVNIRRELHLEGPFVFGLILGSFVVRHEVPQGIGLEELARAIACQTRRIKQGRLYLGAGLELAFGRFLASFYSAERRRKLYQKHYPLWGGISNMDLNPYWSLEESAVVDYLRAVSTGPVTPLVLSITTFGEAANVGLSYRPSIFTEADIEQVKARFLDALNPTGAKP